LCLIPHQTVPPPAHPFSLAINLSKIRETVSGAGTALFKISHRFAGVPRRLSASGGRI
jgi:hypothetical protein